MGNKTILVIEDNELNRKLVRAIFQGSQYNILEAIDAEAGIRMARKERPDLILMDLQLPGMDGLSAARLLKQDPALKQIPVIALTSRAMEGDAKKALEAGCDGYITKPIGIRGFLDTIRKFLPGGPEKNQVSVDDIVPNPI